MTASQKLTLRTVRPLCVVAFTMPFNDSI